MVWTQAVVELRSLCWLKCWLVKHQEGKNEVAALIANTFDEAGQYKIDAEEVRRQGSLFGHCRCSRKFTHMYEWC